MKTSTPISTRLQTGFALFSLALVLYCAILGGNVYQLFAEIPNWSADPAKALIAYRQFFRHSHAGYFFQVFTPLTILCLTASTALLWNRPKAVNRWLLTALAGSVVIEAFTLIYFLPRNFVLFLNPLEHVPAETLLTAARQWQSANYVRLAIALVNVLPILKAYQLLSVQHNRLRWAATQSEAGGMALNRDTVPTPARTVIQLGRGTSFLLALLVTLSLASCKHGGDIVTPDLPGTPTNPQTPVAAVTPVASPEGALITATIGPAGGTVVSADKRLSVTVPAGALTANQTISIQPLNRNHIPLGTGQAYRLLPHGLTFAKPALLTIHYSEQDVNGSAPQALRIAHQTDKGSWQSPATNALDTTAKTISVETTHFSDWGLFQSMRINPDHAFLEPGAHQDLKVSMIPFNDDNSDEIVPLPALMSAKYIEKWTLHGAGTLTHQHNTGDYYAPEKIPATNPAAITVFLNRSATINGQVFKDLRLTANIFVAPEGISFQVGKDEWKTFPGGANLNSVQNIVAGAVGKEHVQIGWVGPSSGTYAWTEGNSVAFLYVNGLFHRSHMYFKVVSGGVLRIDATNPGWVTGTFTLTKAGWLDASSAPPIHGTSAINGVFRVKRV